MFESNFQFTHMSFLRHEVVPTGKAGIYFIVIIAHGFPLARE